MYYDSPTFRVILWIKVKVGFCKTDMTWLNLQLHYCLEILKYEHIETILMTWGQLLSEIKWFTSWWNLSKDDDFKNQVYPLQYKCLFIRWSQIVSVSLVIEQKLTVHHDEYFPCHHDICVCLLHYICSKVWGMFHQRILQQ